MEINQCQGCWNIFDLGFKVTWFCFFKQLFLCNPWANCNLNSCFSLLELGDLSFKWFQSARRQPCPYMVKTLKKIFISRTKKHGTLKLCIKLCQLEAYQVCSNDGAMLTLDLSTKRAVWLSSAFIWERYWKVNFSKDYWWLMYYIWHTYFINQEHENISMSKRMGDLWPLLQGPMNSHFHTTSALKPIMTIFHI